MSDLLGLIQDVQLNKLLDYVTMLSQWNTQDRGHNWSTHHVKGQGDSSQSNGVFSGAVPISRGLDHYAQPSVNLTRAQTPQGMVCQELFLEHSHPFFIKFMARFLQKYLTPYFAKVLIAGNKTVPDLPEFGGICRVRETYVCTIFLINVLILITLSIMHRQIKWIHNMLITYAQCQHQEWIIFGGMGSQTSRCHYSREQAQEGGLKSGQWRFQMALWNYRAPITLSKGVLLWQHIII